ncbi:MAG: hypothetical protein P9L94_04175 [Candidatus Hinthialibacter antarcticus]|nr:hypothetical protein [Candidatus Hinthialibacter antarcticus]
MRQLSDEDLSSYEPLPNRAPDLIEFLIRAIYGAVVGVGLAFVFYSELKIGKIEDAFFIGWPIIVGCIVVSMFFHRNLLEILSWICRQFRHRMWN